MELRFFLEVWDGLRTNGLWKFWFGFFKLWVWQLVCKRGRFFNIFCRLAGVILWLFILLFKYLKIIGYAICRLYRNRFWWMIYYRGFSLFPHSFWLDSQLRVHLIIEIWLMIICSSFVQCLLLGVCLFDELRASMSIWSLSFRGMFGTLDILFLKTGRVLGTSTAWTCNFTNEQLSVWRGVLVLLRKKISQHANSILMDFILFATWPTTTASPLRYSDVIFLVFSWGRMVTTSHGTEYSFSWGW